MPRNRWNKNILVYALVLVLLICMISLLQAIDVSKVDLFYYCALAIVSVAGIAHVNAIQRWLPSHSFSMGLYITMAIMGVAAGTSIIIYVYWSLNPAFLTFIFAFIIPYLCRYACLYFLVSVNSR